MNHSKKVILLILDGWGIAPESPYNAIHNGKTPHFDKLVREYPNVLLKADGLNVGLPDGQVGTSEVNHITIGAGRIILQDLVRINKSLENGDFYKNEKLLGAVDHSVKNDSNLHLVGILSDGGIHSHIEHLFGIFELLHRQKFSKEVFLHLFSDGRDSPPISAERYLKQLEEQLKLYPELKASIATIQGRVFLDRDRDWPKTDAAVDLLIDGKGSFYTHWEALLNYEYNMKNKDEFFNQAILNKEGTIKQNDSIILWNFRTDRTFQLVQRILDRNLENIYFASFAQPSDEFTQLHVVYPRIKVTQTLAETISNANKTQLHITETEKFAHLTFFLNGEKTSEFKGEEWKMIESNRYVKPEYNFEPTMRLFDITKHVVSAIKEDKHDFIVINFCNTDMVGHTGNYTAAVTAVEAVDFCIGKIYEAIEPKINEYALLITADHGNADIMWDDKNNQPHTQHTNSPVPFVLVSDIKCRLDRKESLEDVAPTVLDLMGIEKPKEMTGTSLILER
jgi:2,3-bisphosphoglycerate-independent phosphoglycerate mutase